ncbi:hypothetical protein ACJ73_08396, partial [Blastomyces percursus]
MPPLSTSAASSFVRACTRQQFSSVRPTAAALTSSTQQQRRGRAFSTSTSTTSSFDSPFGQSKESTSTLKIPSFKKYASKSGESSNKVFSYFMAGSMGLVTAVGAKATVH